LPLDRVSKATEKLGYFAGLIFEIMMKLVATITANTGVIPFGDFRKAIAEVFINRRRQVFGFGVFDTIFVLFNSRPFFIIIDDSGQKASLLDSF